MASTEDSAPLLGPSHASSNGAHPPASDGSDARRRVSFDLANPGSDGLGADDDLEKYQSLEDGLDEHDHKHLGGKTIHFFGSLVLTMNNVSGPGMLAIPIIYQQAGIVVPTLLFIFICILASFSATFLCDAIARIPGNSQFEKRVEFATAFRYWFGPKWYYLALVTFVLCLLSQALASIIATAQVMDGAMVLIFKKTYAMDFFPFGIVNWDSSFCDLVNATASTQCVPFQVTPTHDYGQVLTLGYIVTLLVIMPMGAMNLDDNIKIQYLSWATLLIMSVEFCVQYWTHGLHLSDVPWFGTDYSNVVGGVIFNLAFVVTIPSWLNEKRPDVSVNKAVWTSTVLSTLQYIIMGLLGAWSYPNAPSNILQILVSPQAHIGSRICAIIFCFGIIGLGIPVFCIVIRYTLIVGKVCRPHWASFWGVAFPWLVGWLLYQGNAALSLINWTSNIVNGFVNFVAPCLLSLKAMGMLYNSTFFAQLCTSTHKHISTVVAPLPAMVHHHQRAVVVILLTLLTPMVVGSILLDIVQAFQPSSS